MIVDFDPAKDVVNHAKHGVPLAFGARVFEDADLAIVPTVRIGDEERTVQGDRSGRWQAVDGDPCLAWRDRAADLGKTEQCR